MYLVSESFAELPSPKSIGVNMEHVVIICEGRVGVAINQALPEC